MAARSSPRTATAAARASPPRCRSRARRPRSNARVSARIPVSETGATPSPLVLVVDDEAPIRRFLRATLASQGYRYVEAVTAADAVVQATTRVPDLVLLDLGLPDEDG